MRAPAPHLRSTVGRWEHGYNIQYCCPPQKISTARSPLHCPTPDPDPWPERSAFSAQAAHRFTFLLAHRTDAFGSSSSELLELWLSHEFDLGLLLQAWLQT
jgi:hypothetical protein